MMFLRNALFTVPVMLMAACVPEDTPPVRPQPGQPLDMVNPAAAYCESIGGRIENRQEAGGTNGYCHLRNGRIIEQWKLFRSRNKPA